MTSTKQNITINQGETFSMEIALTDTNGNPLDISGYTAASQLRKNYESSNSFSFSTNLVTGILTLSMSANAVTTMWPGRYQYDVFLYANTGVSTKIMEGIAEVIPEITQL